MKNNSINLVIGGNKYHRELITNILRNSDNYLVKDFNSKIETSKSVIYYIYGKGPSPHKNIKLWLSRKNLLILHWIGTDVLNAINPDINTRFYRKVYETMWNFLLRYKSKNNTLVHLAGAPWLVEELATIGIKAKYLPITSINTKNLELLANSIKKDIDVISYVPFKRFSFYGGDNIIKLAEEFPNYKFFLLHPDLDEITPDINKKYPENVITSPKVEFADMQRLYLRSKVFLRLVEHDGLSLSVLESLFYKLQVFWTYPFPNVHHVKDYEAFKVDIQQNIEHWVPNEQGHEYIMDNFQTEDWEIQFREIIDEIVSNNYK